MDAFRLALLIFLLDVATAAQTCYFPDGTVSDNDYPCVDNDDTYTPCCGKGTTCVSNGLCFDGLTMYRSSCTDQSWVSALCTHRCLQYTYSGVWPCDDLGNYSCDYGECSEPFTFSAGMIEVNKELVSSLGLNGPPATITNAPATATVTTTLSPSASLTGTETNAASSSGISAGAAAGIGAGIGVPLLCATVAFAVLYLTGRKKRRQLEIMADGSSQGQHSPSVEYKYAQNQYQQEQHIQHQQSHSWSHAEPMPELMNRSMHTSD